MSLPNPLIANQVHSGRLASIDGLRTLAILAVLIFHTEKHWLPGGYLGVDLFFVISGFVVTRSLMHKAPSYREFLVSRFFRLAPAAAATVFITVLVFQATGSGLLDTSHQASSIFALVALSNMYFMLQNSYFDVALQGNPFLHFWSLSVEEQFYIIWPAVVVALTRWAIAFRIALILALVALSFMLFSLFPDQAFFLMPSRAFQFAFGAGAYFLHDKYQVRWSPLILYGLMAVCILPLVMLDGTQPWWLNTFATTILFTITIFAASNSGAAPILALRPIQAIAAASYSIYLVHWPIIVYLNIVVPPSLAVQAVALLTSLAFGFALHYLIERPLNNPPKDGESKRGRRVKMRPLGPILAGVTLIFTSFVSWSSFAGYRTPAATENIGESAEAALERLLPKPIERKTEAPALATPSVPVKRATVPVVPLDMTDPAVVIRITSAARAAANAKGNNCNTFEAGRRQGNQASKLLADLDLQSCLQGSQVLFADSTWIAASAFLSTTLNTTSLGQLNSSGCSFTVEAAADPDCQLTNDKRKEFIASSLSASKTLYLAFNWSNLKASEINALVDFVGDSGRQVAFLSQTPQFTNNPAQIISANAAAKQDLSPWLKQFGETRVTLRQAVAKYENLKVLDWSPLDDEPVKLPAVTDAGADIYSDVYHLTPAGIEWYITQYILREEDLKVSTSN